MNIYIPIVMQLLGGFLMGYGVREALIKDQKVGTYSYPDEYVESLPGIIMDPSEKLDSIWPLYKMPDTDRFYIIGEWKAFESGAPTKSKQTWIQRIK